MRALAVLSLLLVSAPTVIYAAGNSIVDLNSATPNPTAVVATAQPTVAPAANPVTGQTPFVPLVIALCISGIIILYAIQRRSA